MPTAATIYDVPLILEASGLGDYIARNLGIDGTPDLAEWQALVDEIKRPRRRVRSG